MITIPPEGNVHVCTSYHSNSSSSCLRFRDQSFLSWAGQLTGCSVSSQVKSLVKAIQVRSASQPLTPDCNIKLWSMLDTDKSFESSFPKCSHKSLTAMLSVKSFIFWQFKSTPVHMSANVYSKMCCWKGQQVYQNPSYLLSGNCECLWRCADPCGRYWDVSQDEWKFAGGEGNVQESQNLWGFIWDISLNNSTLWWPEGKHRGFNKVRSFLWEPWTCTHIEYYWDI